MATPTDPSRPRPLRSSAAAAAALVLIALGLSACGDDSDDVAAGSGEPTTSTAAPGGGDDGYGSPGGGDSGAAGATTIVAKDFSLTSISVAPGTDVKVDNGGSATHTVTADDGSFDSGRIGGGSSGSITAPSEPGDYAFHCAIHSSMTGTLTVEG